MTKEKAPDAAALAKINDPDRPTLPDNTFPDPSVLEHNWQPGSPAIDLRDPATAAQAVNTVQQAEAKLKEEKPKKRVISQAEFDRRKDLPVNDADYINESLEHYDVK